MGTDEDLVVTVAGDDDSYVAKTPTDNGKNGDFGQINLKNEFPAHLVAPAIELLTSPLNGTWHNIMTPAHGKTNL